MNLDAGYWQRPLLVAGWGVRGLSVRRSGFSRLSSGCAIAMRDGFQPCDFGGMSETLLSLIYMHTPITTNPLIYTNRTPCYSMLHPTPQTDPMPVCLDRRPMITYRTINPPHNHQLPPSPST